MWSNVKDFAQWFLLHPLNYNTIPRQGAITNFGNIISFLLYRKEQFQVEMFISPFNESSFTTHTHPNVDVIEFPLTGHVNLKVNDRLVASQHRVEQWLRSERLAIPFHIKPGVSHSGSAQQPYAFLSLQHWLNGVTPSSVGLDWQGEASSLEQEAMWATSKVTGK